MPYNILAQKIREIRFRAGLKQEEFAKRCNAKRATVSRWESGTSEPRARHLKAIAELANITVDELLAEPEEPRRIA